jgi:hypothetical protein
MADHVRLSVDEIEYPAVIVDVDVDARNSLSFRVALINLMRHLADPERYRLIAEKIILTTWLNGDSELTELDRESARLSLRMAADTGQLYLKIDFRSTNTDVMVSDEYRIHV